MFQSSSMCQTNGTCNCGRSWIPLNVSVILPFPQYLRWLFGQWLILDLPSPSHQIWFRFWNKKKCCNNFNEFPFGFYGFWLDLNELINCLPNTLPTALWRFHLRVSVKVSKFHFLCISQLKRPEEKDEWRGIFEKSSIISLFVSLKLCEIPHLNKCK